MKVFRIDQLKKSLREDHEPSDSELAIYFRKCKEIMKAEKSKKFELDESVGTIFPTPREDYFNMLIAGPSGSGKSTFIGTLCKELQKKHKKATFYVFSKIQDDPAYQNINNVVYIKLDDSIVHEPMNIDEFKGTKECYNYLIFDDSEHLGGNPTISKALFAFMNLALTTSRHSYVNNLVVSHILLNRYYTLNALNEATYVVLYPRANMASIRNYLHRYLSFTREQTNTVKDMGRKSRWVLIHRNYPQYIISQQQISIF